MTADLAIVAMATVTALQVILDHRHRMKVADRERLVGPVKAQQPKPGSEAKAPGVPAAEELKPRAVAM